MSDNDSLQYHPDESSLREKSKYSSPLHTRKRWSVPKDKDSYQTFIDHGCRLDPEGYPFYPNGATIFVQQPEIQTFRNFGSVGFTKTTSLETTRNEQWQVKRIYCLGVMLCNNDDCQWAGSPPTGEHAIDKYLTR